MSQLQVGDKMPDFTYDTPFARGLKLSDTAAEATRTALLFLRYYGCTVCQYDLLMMSRQYEEISAHGGQLLAVLQSDPDKLAPQLEENPLPFPVICDPEQTLYHRFEIKKASDMEAMGDARVWEKIEKATALGLTHGEYEGEELQLPAAFVFTPDLTLTYAHYAATAGDIPDPKELAALLS